ncbi:hypothetical protein Moror_11169 [Moniliophthora roreri MCA 2997]|uniref:Uncharacterized protein n=1 Tax=Moniliophthora roreri (strain MCA 2997) TaxID=1381753 RepID=V2WM94_MONRO|nr:hypothetical protein Moror_11169 [Moniliophthora roreri MCA 2997]
MPSSWKNLSIKSFYPGRQAIANSGRTKPDFNAQDRIRLLPVLRSKTTRKNLAALFTARHPSRLWIHRTQPQLQHFGSIRFPARRLSPRGGVCGSAVNTEHMYRSDLRVIASTRSPLTTSCCSVLHELNEEGLSPDEFRSTRSLGRQKICEIGSRCTRDLGYLRKGFVSVFKCYANVDDLFPAHIDTPQTNKLAPASRVTPSDAPSLAAVQTTLTRHSRQHSKDILRRSRPDRDPGRGQERGGVAGSHKG